MTIEKTPTASPSPKAHASPNGQAAKTSKSVADAPTDAASTGFLAILGALDAPMEELALPAAPAVSATPADPQDPADTAALAVPLDATLLLQQNPQIAAAQAAQAALRAAPGQSKRAGPEGGDASIPAAGRQADRATPEAVASKTLPDVTTQDRARVNLPASSAAPAQPADPQATVAPMATGLPRAGAHAKPGKGVAALAGADTTTSSAHVASSATARVEPKDFKLLSTLEQARAAPQSRALESLVVPLMVKAERPQNERATMPGRSSDPTYSGTSLGVAGPDFSQMVDQASAAMSPEMQVAEQVTYWVSQNIKNAEMKLDGLGQDPVEVSISVQGNEAQIAFRSDEAQTRSVLEGAGIQLKEMLQREGLLLTGVSVGTSGGGDASGAGGERRGRPNPRQTQVAAAEEVKVTSGRRTGVEVGSAVDLFV